MLCWGLGFCLREFFKTKEALKTEPFVFLGFIFYFGLFSKIILISKNSL
ncbi:hypothetical protein HPHPH28_0186 [Helicobacter pylori Hp H-28]|nr:hypothetical protein HPHPH28_0186 [Helicobacter pylori Hp H-28]